MPFFLARKEYTRFYSNHLLRHTFPQFFFTYSLICFITDSPIRINPKTQLSCKWKQVTEELTTLIWWNMCWRIGFICQELDCGEFLLQLILTPRERKLAGDPGPLSHGAHHKTFLQIIPLCRGTNSWFSTVGLSRDPSTLCFFFFSIKAFLAISQLISTSTRR